MGEPSGALGGASVVLGLLSLGLHFPVIQFFEGYKCPRLLKPVWWALRKIQRRRRTRETDAWRQDRRFPAEDRLLPTRIGNAIRAAEDYAYDRWGLDTIAIWPRVEPLLNEQERELHTSANTTLAYFLNGTINAWLVGIVLILDELRNDVRDGWSTAVYAIPFVVGVLTYRFAIGAAERWGTERRASIDLHRLEVYERLGIRRPTSPADEKSVIAPALNGLLLYGEPLPDDVMPRGTPGNEDPDESRSGTAVKRLFGNWRKR